MKEVYDISLKLTDNQIVAIKEAVSQELAEFNDLMKYSDNENIKQGFSESIYSLKDILIQLENI